MKKIAIILILLLLTLTLFAKDEAKSKEKPKPIITFVELGSVNCVPCKMMQPVMKDIETEYKEKVQVIFHDVNKEKGMAEKYKIRVIPTQVFLDKDGKEFHRHEGFYPKEEIMKILDPKLGIIRKK